MMTFEERVVAVAQLGFTERQARFLVHVMLFGGLCLPRQYARFNGRAYGHVVTEFFAKLVRRRHVTPCRCLHNRGRLYHVHDRQLYAAIGEPRHPHRRPVPVRQVVERLMRLDSVITNPKIRWLVSEPEKAAFVRRLAPSLPLEGLPHVRVGAGPRARLKVFPDDVLMGVDEAQRPWFVYVDSRDLLASETHPESGTTVFNQYDPAGLLERKTDANGTVFEYEYDENDRVTTIKANGQTTSTITYESGTDNRQTVSSGTVVTTFGYDAAGRPDRRQDVVGPYLFSSQYEYDGNDTVRKITYPSGRKIASIAYIAIEASSPPCSQRMVRICRGGRV